MKFHTFSATGKIVETNMVFTITSPQCPTLNIDTSIDLEWLRGCAKYMATQMEEDYDSIAVYPVTC